MSLKRGKRGAKSREEIVVRVGLNKAIPSFIRFRRVGGRGLCFWLPLFEDMWRLEEGGSEEQATIARRVYENRRETGASARSAGPR